jgi:glucose/arabinose dehydrogenase
MAALRPRPVRYFVYVAIGLAAAALLYFVYLVWGGGVALSDRTMLWRMLRDQGIEAPSEDLVSRQLRVPAGYRVTRWAADLPSARMMTMTATGELIVAQPRGGLVSLLARDADGDGRSDGRTVLFTGLDRPNGVDLHEGWLYIAESTRISRVRFDALTGRPTGALMPVVEGLGGDGNHWRKTARIGPDGRLYVGSGSTCNVCLEEDRQRATIWVYAADGTGGGEYATGLRNPTGFDWAPWDGALYATENGRDLLGDDLPPDELNRIEQGVFYGWPYVHGDGLPDPEFGRGTAAGDGEGVASRVAAARKPVHAFRAHNAPLGMRFLRHPVHAPDHDRVALVALHGSWNRSVPDGYAVVALHWQADGRIEERPFLSGFRSEAGLIGRPVDVVESAEGEIYVSDDYAGVVYRITRSTPPIPVAAR